MMNSTMNTYETTILAPLHPTTQLDLLKQIHRGERIIWTDSPATSVGASCSWGCCVPALLLLWFSMTLCKTGDFFGQTSVPFSIFLTLFLLSFAILCVPFYFNYLRERTGYVLTNSRAIIIEPLRWTPWLSRSLYFPLTPDLVKEVRMHGKTGDVIFSEKNEYYLTTKIPGSKHLQMTTAYPKQIGFRDIDEPYLVANMIDELTQG